MNDEQESDKQQGRLTLGGLFLWLTCVSLMLGHYLQLFDWIRVRSEAVQLQQSYIYFSATQGAWVTGSSLFAAIFVGWEFVRGRSAISEPGIVLLLALFTVQLPQLVWGTVEAWHIDPSDPLAQSIDDRFLIWGLRAAHILEVGLYIWACYTFRGSRVWLVVFCALAVRLVAYFVGLYPHVRIHYPISYRSFFEPLYVWSPLVLVVLGAITDLFRREHLSWLHFLGIVTWIASFMTILLLSIGVKFP